MSLGGKTHILIANVPDHYVDAAGVAVSLTQPANRMEFGAYGREVTWNLAVLGVTGTPTTWSLGVKVQDCLENTTGPQYGAPQWYDFDTLRTEFDVIEKAGWYGPGQTPPASAGAYGLVATQASTLPVQVSRTIVVRNLRHRLALQPAFTGGTSPQLRLALTATVRS